MESTVFELVVSTVFVRETACASVEKENVVFLGVEQEKGCVAFSVEAD